MDNPTNKNAGIRWSIAEDEKLITGIRTHGYGRWKDLSTNTFQGSRTSSQIKTRVAHLFKHGHKTIDNMQVVLAQYKNKSSFDLSAISEQERIFNAEFFTGNSSKTPERYLKIRNYIVQLWLQKRPEYVTKRVVRQGLVVRKNACGFTGQDCGDVNAIGRVHEFLEINGIINCDEKVEKNDNFANEMNCDSATGTDASDADCIRDNLHTPITSNHNIDTSNNQTTTNINNQSLPLKRKRTKISISEEWNRLVPSNPFRNSPPFKVQICPHAMLIMEFHSHLIKHEIIGLLGGTFIDGCLNVVDLFPCHSPSSSQTHCEMDPYSEMQAREYFGLGGIHVVGWYHSHPTFDPFPSLRDIDTQTSYQKLFKQENGIEPFIGNDLISVSFIGIIISPYKNIVTQTECLVMVEDSNNSWTEANRSPFSVPFVLGPQCIPISNVYKRITQLYHDYKKNPFVINLKESFKGCSRREKLLNSLRVYYGGFDVDFFNRLLE